MADVVWLRKRLVGGGECIGAFFRADALRTAAAVEGFDAVTDAEYPRDRADCGPGIESGASESRGDEIICRTCSLAFGLPCIGSTIWLPSVFATGISESWRDLSCGEGCSIDCCFVEMLDGLLETSLVGCLI